MKTVFEILVRIKVAQPWVDDGLTTRAIKQKLEVFFKERLIGSAAARDLKIELIQIKQIEGAVIVDRDKRTQAGLVDGAKPS